MSNPTTNRVHKPVVNPKDDFVFHAISWHAEDIDYADIDNEEDTHLDYTKYVIKAFGATLQGDTVSVTISNFTPYFYIRVDDNWGPREVEALRDHIIGAIHGRLRNAISSIKLMKRMDFWGFTNFKKFKFIRICFRNHRTMRIVAKLMTEPCNIRQLGRTFRFKCYESNIDPYIRFMHLQDVEPVGWIRLPAGRFKKDTEVLPTICQYDLEIDWKHVEKHDCELNAPFLVASFDIECMSNSGDFPVAKKDYKKLASDLFELYNNVVGNRKDALSKAALIEQAILYAFGIHDDFQYASTIRKLEPKDRVKTESLQNLLKRHADVFADMLSGKHPKFGVQKPTRDAIIKLLTDTLSSPNLGLPHLKGDAIIQIGTTFHFYGDKECCLKHVVTLGTCDDVPGAIVESCETEEELLLKWRAVMTTYNPDIVTGYNIFGFDFPYMYDRACELGIASQFMKIGRFTDKPCKWEEKKLSSSALGDNILRYIDMHGRVLIDLMKVIQRDHKLDSFKLDNVAATFLKGTIQKIDGNNLSLNAVGGINEGDFVRLGDGNKYKITAVDAGTNQLTIDQPPPTALSKAEMSWSLAKDDICPRDIFECQKGSATDRARIAKYCIQDCALCNHLIMKLEILANNMGMANVCLVPLSFIFMRGQGIKIFSLVLKQCKEDGFLIPVLSKPPPKKEDAVVEEDDDSYEGAIVLEPKEGIYIDTPISVLDYASLYPSSMISENLSHDCAVLDEQYDNLPGVEYLDISYDLYEGTGDKKRKCGEKRCRFVQIPEKGLIPRILMKLLKARKTTRKKAEIVVVKTSDGQEHKGWWDANAGVLTAPDGQQHELDKGMVVSVTDYYNEFQKAVLDGLQLAYKVTANSLYGQCGARTSQIYMKDIAACTTATGRKMIMMAKEFLEKNHAAHVVYGDTDSIFIAFDNKDADGNPVSGKAAIMPSIQSAIKASSEFKKLIKQPHDLEYEKTFWPFVLLSKKRYVGNLYEMDDKKFKQKSMGIVLKRRDNANIVKKVYGGIIDTILNKQDVQASVSFLKQSLQDLIEGKCPMEDLIITKSLRADYKDPNKIAHKVLVERIGERDPGNKPQVNDRVPFVYIEQPPMSKGKKVLQGERIEHPDYIIKNKLKPDYTFYITNQIMKPVLQVYGIIAHDLAPNPQKKLEHYQALQQRLSHEYKDDAKKAKEKFMSAREADAQAVLFDPVLQRLENIKNGNNEITRYFSVIRKQAPHKET